MSAVIEMVVDGAEQPDGVEAPGKSLLLDVCRDSFVLMRVQASAPSRTRTSERATMAAREATGAEEGSYHSETMLKSLAREIAACAKRARRHLEENSCPFGEARLVLLSDYANVRGELADMAREYRAIAEAATGDWEEYQRLVQEQTQGLWGESVLPEVREEYVAGFELLVEMLPMPVVPKQISLPRELAEELLQQEIEEGVHAQYQRALRSQVLESADAIEETLGRLARGKRTTRPTFRVARLAARQVRRFNRQERRAQWSLARDRGHARPGRTETLRSRAGVQGEHDARPPIPPGPSARGGEPRGMMSGGPPGVRGELTFQAATLRELSERIEERLCVLETFWLRLDMHFRPLDVRAELVKDRHPAHLPMSTWPAIGCGTADMLFHSPRVCMARLIAEPDLGRLWAHRRLWWEEDVELDVVLTLHTYLRAHARRGAMTEPGSAWLEFGSLPLSANAEEDGRGSDDGHRSMTRGARYRVPVMLEPRNDSDKLRAHRQVALLYPDLTEQRAAGLDVQLVTLRAHVS